MYSISDQQIDYILDDIKRNGIQMEDLQLNLLDHVCCLLEQQLKDGDDFEFFYHKTIRQFYSKELKEIEAETVQLLTFKNYFMMKKIMITAGVFSTFSFLLGSLFKIMFWPGAAVLMTLAIAVFCFFFLPMLFILKTKEVNTGLEKMVIALGTVLGILFCLSILFKVQHWPGATMLLFAMMLFAFFIFIPLYFFSGYRKPETRLNTILTSILLIGFTAVTFLSVNVYGPSSKQMDEWTSYCQSEMIWQKVIVKNHISETQDADAVIKNTDSLKAAILALTSTDAPKNNYTVPGKLKFDNLKYLGKDGSYSRICTLLANLQESVKKYNHAQLNDADKIPDGFAFADMTEEDFGRMENVHVLNNLTQLQIYVVSAAADKTGVVIR